MRARSQVKSAHRATRILLPSGENEGQNSLIPSFVSLIGAVPSAFMTNAFAPNAAVCRTNTICVALGGQDALEVLDAVVGQPRDARAVGVHQEELFVLEQETARGADPREEDLRAVGRPLQRSLDDPRGGGEPPQASLRTEYRSLPSRLLWTK